uniref:Uncharacterized protein n=1 Tax=Variovorax sp. HH01 TaxID=1084736 RepID=I3PCP7_9BURK|nr:hypothetical protein var077 [Variovorax sp. HH01]
MVALVTPEEVKSQLMMDNDAADGWINLMIQAISGAVMTWLKDEWRAYVVLLGADGKPVLDSNGDPIVLLDSNGDAIVKPVVKAAALVEIASQFRFRDGDGAAAVPATSGHGYVLGAGATNLLSGLRRSTVK